MNRHRPGTNYCHRTRAAESPLPEELPAWAYDLAQCRQGNHRWEDVGNYRVNGRDMPKGARRCVCCGALRLPGDPPERAEPLP